MNTPLGPSSSVHPSLADRLLDEGIKPIVVAAAEEGIKISAKTALRWALKGTARAQLESIRVAGRRMTSRAAIRRFLNAQQGDNSPTVPAIDQRAADEVLEAHGLGRCERK